MELQSSGFPGGHTLPGSALFELAGCGAKLISLSGAGNDGWGMATSPGLCGLSQYPDQPIPTRGQGSLSGHQDQLLREHQSPEVPPVASGCSFKVRWGPEGSNRPWDQILALPLRRAQRGQVSLNISFFINCGTILPLPALGARGGREGGMASLRSSFPSQTTKPSCPKLPGMCPTHPSLHALGRQRFSFQGTEWSVILLV